VKKEDPGKGTIWPSISPGNGR